MPTKTKSPEFTKEFEALNFIDFTCRGRGIRTPGPREGSPVFKTGAINRSTIPLFALRAFRKGSAKVRHKFFLPNFPDIPF